jgi:hypothetical protein
MGADNPNVSRPQATDPRQTTSILQRGFSVSKTIVREFPFIGSDRKTKSFYGALDYGTVRRFSIS